MRGATVATPTPAPTAAPGATVTPAPTPVPATSVGWSQSSPQYQGLVTATWTASTSSATAQKLQYYQDGTCSTPLGSLNDVGVGTTTYALSVADPGTYTYQVTTINGTESSVSTCSAPMVIKQVFYQGIAFGNDATNRTINGNSWLTTAQAVSAGLAFTTPASTFNSTGGLLCDGTTPVSLSPPVSGDTQAMLYHLHWNSGGHLGFNYPLPSATYRIYLYSHENCSTNYRAVNIQLEGATFESAAERQAANEWQRWGPYDVTVTDGTLNVLLERVAGDPLLSGLEIFKVAPAGTSLFADDFNSGIAGTAWNQWSPSGLYAVNSSGQVSVTPPANTAPNGTADNTYAGVSLSSSVSLDGRAISLELVQKLNSNASWYDETFFGLKVDSNNFIYFYSSGGYLEVYLKAGGTTTHLSSTAYSAANHRYLRMRHDTMTDWVVCETSADGVNWRQFTKFQKPFMLYGTPEFGAGVWATSASPGTALFDNFKFIQN